VCLDLVCQRCVFERSSRASVSGSESCLVGTSHAFRFSQRFPRFEKRLEKRQTNNNNNNNNDNEYSFRTRTRLYRIQNAIVERNSSVSLTPTRTDFTREQGENAHRVFGWARRSFVIRRERATPTGSEKTRVHSFLINEFIAFANSFIHQLSISRKSRGPRGAEQCQKSSETGFAGVKCADDRDLARRDVWKKQQKNAHVGSIGVLPRYFEMETIRL